MTLALLLATMLAGGPQAPPGVTAMRGLVIDARTASPVRDARVVLVELGRSTQTGADGHFDFPNVPPGGYTVTVSRIGYIFVRRHVDLSADATLDLTIPLAEGTGTYQETVNVGPTNVSASEPGVGSQSEMGSAGLQDLRGVAADDPMRAMQALPGVATGDDFQAEFSVRGSEFRHVGVVIDDTATPLLLHTVRSINETGSIAMLNSDVLDRASLMAGPHPQRHGDWLGATLDFGLREGSRDRTQLRGAVSGTSASLVVEGPMGRAKRGSWLTSIRKSYIDWLIKKIDPSINGTLGFSDAQSKFVYDLTTRQQVQFILVAGDTGFEDVTASPANGLYNANSESVLGSAAWRYTRSSLLLTQRVSFVGSRFKDLGVSSQELGRGYARSNVWRGDATWFLNKAWSVGVGAKSEWQHETVTERSFSLVSNQPKERFVASTANDTDVASTWGEVARRTARSGLSAGVRMTRDSLSGRTVASPWLLGERKLGPLTLRASTGISHQFPELEFQRALTGRLPERAEMFDVGMEEELPRGMRWQVTGFSREDSDVIRRIGEDRLVNGQRVAASVFPQFASTLSGPTRGMDLLFARRGRSGLTGWIAYTYSHTRYHDSATGESFDGDFDQRHTLNMFVQESLSYRMAVSAKLRVGSNFPLTGYFQGTLDALTLSAQRNNVRLPTYVRLDVRANRTFTFDRRRLTLFVELVNATSHDNLGQAPGFISGSALNALNYTHKLIPFIPSVGMLVEF